SVTAPVRGATGQGGGPEVIATALMVRVQPPVLATCTCCVLQSPMHTSPKSSALGRTSMVPGLAFAVTGTAFTGVVGSSLVMLIVVAIGPLAVAVRGTGTSTCASWVKGSGRARAFPVPRAPPPAGRAGSSRAHLSAVGV